VPLLLKKRREGRKKWVKGLDNRGNIEGFFIFRFPEALITLGRER
jgi:hypothetical protein